MNRYLINVIVPILLLLLLAGFGMAAESSTNIIYIQGGAGTITNGTDGGKEITIKDLVPYVYITEEGKSQLISVGDLTKVAYPVTGALVFSIEKNASVSMVTIANLSLADDNTLLTLKVTPLKFYDGEALKDFANAPITLDEIDFDKVNAFSAYIDAKQKVLENC